MGFDFLLVQPQAFIEKKKPRLRRYHVPGFIFKADIGIFCVPTGNTEIRHQ